MSEVKEKAIIHATRAVEGLKLALTAPQRVGEHNPYEQQRRAQQAEMLAVWEFMLEAAKAHNE